MAVFAGGALCIDEMEANVAQERPMILLAGSGRTTNQVLAARAGQPVDDPRLVALAYKAQILPFDTAAAAPFNALVRRVLQLVHTK